MANDKHNVSLQASPYYRIRDELTFQDGLILKRERVLIHSQPTTEDEDAFLLHGSRSMFTSVFSGQECLQRSNS